MRALGTSPRSRRHAVAPSAQTFPARGRYVILAEGVADTPDLVPSLKMSVRNEIGGLAIPDGIAIVSGLPKTRASL